MLVSAIHIALCMQEMIAKAVMLVIRSCHVLMYNNVFFTHAM